MKKVYKLQPPIWTWLHLVCTFENYPMNSFPDFDFDDMYTGFPKENTWCLIWCKMKRTVFTGSAFIVSGILIFQFEVWYKISWKFTKEWLLKAKILGPANERTMWFLKKYTNLKQLYCFIKVHWSVTFLKLKKTQLFYLIALPNFRKFWMLQMMQHMETNSSSQE